jgi:hypothetical protein
VPLEGYEIVGNDKDCYYQKVEDGTNPDPQICPMCGHEAGHCTPGCMMGSSCICNDTIPGTQDFNSVITISNLPQLEYVIANDTVNGLLQNPHCVSLTINAQGLVQVGLNSMNISFVPGQLLTLTQWKGYENSEPKLTVNMPDNSNVYPAGQDIRVANAPQFISTFSGLNPYFKLAAQTQTAYFGTSKINDTIYSYRVVPDTVSLQSIVDLDVIDNSLMEIPGKSYFIANPNNYGLTASHSSLSKINFGNGNHTYTVGNDPYTDNGTESNQQDNQTQRKFHSSSPLNIRYINTAEVLTLRDHRIMTAELGFLTLTPFFSLKF